MLFCLQFALRSKHFNGASLKQLETRHRILATMSEKTIAILQEERPAVLTLLDQVAEGTVVHGNSCNNSVNDGYNENGYYLMPIIGHCPCNPIRFSCRNCNFAERRTGLVQSGFEDAGSCHNALLPWVLGP